MASNCSKRKPNVNKCPCLVVVQLDWACWAWLRTSPADGPTAVHDINYTSKQNCLKPTNMSFFLHLVDYNNRRYAMLAPTWQKQKS
jgi:hypothetical protein